MKRKQEEFFKILSVSFSQVLVVNDTKVFVKDYLGRVFLLGEALVKALDLHKLEHMKIYRIGVKGK